MLIIHEGEMEKNDHLAKRGEVAFQQWFKMNVYSAVVCMNVILYIQGSGFFGPFAVNALIHNH